MNRLSPVLLLFVMASAPSMAAPPGPGEEAPQAAAPAAPAWLDFGKKAFDEAAEKNRLVLLYISAPWNFRDHTMETATFTDPAVLEVIRKHYVPVKVDTNLRPDVFGRYGLGAWPTTTVLLPDGSPFFHPGRDGKSAKRAGGTFYSPALFESYFTQLAEYYAGNEELVKSVSHTTSQTILSRINVERGKVEPGALEVVVGSILDAYKERPPEPVPGSYLPDFPMVRLVWYYWERKSDRRVLDVALNHLTEMARGGIYDRLEGGFFRMAQDSMFRVPEFEKLPSVNAQALDAYLDAYQVTHNGVFLIFARGVMNYFQLHALDAETHAFLGAMNAWNDEGSGSEYYTWTEDECRALLTPEEFGVLSQAYDISPLGELVEIAPRANVIYMLAGPKLLAKLQGIAEDRSAELLESGGAKLLEARRKRPAPAVDPTTYANWSGMAISAFLHAGRVLDEPEYIDQALAALDVLLDRCRAEDGFVAHACRPAKGERSSEALLADQGRVAYALLDAYEQTARDGYLQAAEKIAGGVTDRLKDSLSGGFTDREQDPNAIGLMAWPLREMDEEMNMAEVLLRLKHLTGEASYEVTARKVIESWADEAGKMGPFAASFGLAADKLLHEPLAILIAGETGDPGVAALREQALRLHHPWRVVRSLGREAGAAEMERRGLPAAPGGAAAALCFGDDCAGPYGAQEDLDARLREFLGRASAKSGKGGGS